LICCAGQKTGLDADGWVLEHAGGQPRNVMQHYVVTQELGKGAFGSVSKVAHRKTKVERAMKAIVKKREGSPAQSGPAIRQEVSMMKMMDHPNVVRMVEYFEDRMNVYLVMELCSGGELFDRLLKAGSYSERVASTTMKQILSAVYFCHAQDIVHRDLKPENFMYLNDSPGSPLKLIDFGMAKRCVPGQVLATKFGTPYYVAPQVLQAKYDRSCDVWSCGVILYILLAGYPPFNGECDGDILRRVRIGAFDVTEDEWQFISEDAKTLVKSCLVMDPAKRITAEKALHTPWIQKLDSSAPEKQLLNAADFQKRLRNFQKESHLKKVAMTIVARQMDDAHMEKMKNTFMALDKNGDGQLSLEEVQDGVKDLGLGEWEAEALAQLLKDADVDGNGSIDYSEFLASTMHRKEMEEESRLWSAFCVFDMDGSGTITVDELEKVLQDPSIRSMSAGADCTALLKEHDLNCDGMIDFEEFLVMMRGAKLAASHIGSASP